MRNITSKQSHSARLRSELSREISDKCHNIIVFIEEEIETRLSKGAADTVFAIPDTLWSPFQHNYPQQGVMRQHITDTYVSAGWVPNWFRDTDATIAEWEIILK